MKLVSEVLRIWFDEKNANWPFYWYNRFHEKSKEHNTVQCTQWNQLFSNFFSKNVTFTKFLPKKCEREFPQFPHCDAVRQWFDEFSGKLILVIIIDLQSFSTFRTHTWYILLPKVEFLIFFRKFRQCASTPLVSILTIIQSRLLLSSLQHCATCSTVSLRQHTGVYHMASKHAIKTTKRKIMDGTPFVIVR